MKVKIKEADIQRAILDYLQVKKIFAWQNDTVGIFDPKRKVYRSNPRKTRGVPDILGIYKGKPLGIEVKSSTGRLRDCQAQFLARFRDEGGIAFVARSIEDVEQELRKATA